MTNGDRRRSVTDEGIGAGAPVMTGGAEGCAVGWDGAAEPVTFEAQSTDRDGAWVELGEGLWGEVEKSGGVWRGAIGGGEVISAVWSVTAVEAGS